MNKLVSKSQFKAKALEFFRSVQLSGESIIVTDHGKPVLEIKPYKDGVSDPLADLRDSVLHYDDPLAPVAQDDWENA